MPTDFFERQDTARRRTRAMAVLLVVTIVVTLVVLAAISTVPANLVSAWMHDDRVERRSQERARAESLVRDLQSAEKAARELGLPPPQLEPVVFPPAMGRWQWSWWWPRTWLCVMAGGAVCMLASGLQKRSELAGGGHRVALVLGGRPADPKSDTPVEQGLSERQLVHVVEEMAIAAGLPVPRVYVLPRERSINAFAAGLGPGDACVVATIGALQHLSRDELQAVVAHEFSHILNGDILLNQRLIIAVFAVGGLGMLGTGFLRAITTETEGEGAILLAHPIGWAIGGVAVVLATVGSVGMGSARFLQAAVNRQREFLADASAVQFTRNPRGLAGALKKVGGYRRQGRLLNVHAAEIAHLCIAPPSYQVLATHPPLSQRIIAVDPSFDGVFPRLHAVDPEVQHRLTATQERVRTEYEQKRRHFEAERAATSMLAGELIATAGMVDPPHIVAAQRLLRELPVELREAVHDTAGAMAVALALILDPDADARRTQLEQAADQAIAIAAKADRLFDQVHALAASHRLPLLDLALPTLELLDQPRRRTLVKLLNGAALADESLALRELCYLKIVEHALLPSAQNGGGSGIYSVQGFALEIRTLLRALSRFSGDCETSYAVSVSHLRLREEPAAPATPSAVRVLAALEAISSAPSPIKRRILDAAARCAATDGVITLEEYELIRALAATMSVPIPPAVVLSAMPIEAPPPNADAVTVF